MMEGATIPRGRSAGSLTIAVDTREKYGWKFYTLAWKGATAGDHTLLSRATDVNGKVQPTAQENATKKSFLEENSQVLRKVRIA